MVKKLITGIAVFLAGTLLYADAYAQVTERLRIITYYPAPYGSYRQVRTDSLVVGSAYRSLAPGIATDGDVFVSGRVNIGTAGAESDLLSVLGNPVGYHTAAFRTSNDFGVAVGGLNPGTGVIAAGGVQAYQAGSASAQTLFINRLGNNVRVGGTGSYSAPYQLTVYCANLNTCIGGKFNGANTGVVRLAWNAGYYFKAVYDTAPVIGSPWTDNPLNAGTAIKAQHIIELRNAVNLKRPLCGLGLAMWTNDPIVAGATSVKAVHLSEIAAAIQGIYTAKSLGSTGIVSPLVGAIIRIADINALRNAISSVSCP